MIYTRKSKFEKTTNGVLFYQTRVKVDGKQKLMQIPLFSRSNFPVDMWKTRLKKKTENEKKTFRGKEVGESDINNEEYDSIIWMLFIKMK